MDNFTDSIKTINETGKLQCNICSINISNSNMIQHTFNHYNHLGFSADMCLFCNRSVGIDSVEPILEHMMFCHEMKSACPLCRTRFKSMDDLYYHLQNNIKIVHHCHNLGCSLMTDKKIHFLKHLKETKHRKKFNFKEAVYFCKYGDTNHDNVSIECSFPKSTHVQYKEFDYYDKENSPRDKDGLYLPEKEKNLKRKSNESGSYLPVSRGLKLANGKQCVKNDVIQTDLKKSFYVFSYSEQVLVKYLAILNKSITENLKIKLDTLKLYSMSISTIEGVRRFTCESCNYFSVNSHIDIKRHIVRYHCNVSNQNLYIAMKVSRNNANIQLLSNREMVRQINSEIRSQNPDNAVLLSESEDDASANQIIEPIKSLVKKSIHKFTYSERVLRKYVDNDQVIIEEFRTKLKDLSSFTMSILIVDRIKKYICDTCNYFSVHTHTDIKRHIFRFHCKFNSKFLETLFKVSRSNSDIVLLSDSELIDQINNEISLKSLDSSKLLTDSDDESVNNIAESQRQSSFKKTDLQLVRQIPLEYSPAILKSICRMETSEAAFESLRRKMDIYANHGVEVYQRNHKPLYTCSRCNWYSKQNIDEVIKHALNVHANLEVEPKSIRKIAEFCSKTNKDYQLLSDQELCFRGWKGHRILE